MAKCKTMAPHGLHFAMTLRFCGTVLDARLDVLHFEVGIVVSDEGVKWNALANQFQNVLDGDAGAGHTGFSKMNVRCDLDSILHVGLPAACPFFALNALMAQRYTQAQAAGKRTIARGIDNRGPAVAIKIRGGFGFSQPAGRMSKSECRISRIAPHP